MRVVVLVIMVGTCTIEMNRGNPQTSMHSRVQVPSPNSAHDAQDFQRLRKAIDFVNYR